MRPLRSLAQVVPLVVVLAVPATAGAAYHVSPRGSNAAPGTAARPWRTIQYAVAHAPGGATVLLASGTYPAFTWRSVSRRA